MISRRKVSHGLAAAALAPWGRRAGAQGAYPGSLTIKLVVPYPPGGATDVIGRIVAERLAALWRTTVIVENVAGAAANIGMDRVAKGPADGTQVLVVPPQIAINQFLYAKLAFDPEKDLVPVAQVASLPGTPGRKVGRIKIENQRTIGEQIPEPARLAILVGQREVRRSDTDLQHLKAPRATPVRGRPLP